MKKSIDVLFYIIFFILILQNTTGCIEDKNENGSISFDNRFVGVWKGKGELDIGDFTYIFYKNNSCEVNEYHGTYEFNLTHLSIVIDNIVMAYTYSFSNNYQNLNMVNINSKNTIHLTKS